ncbi:MAG: cobyrinate a,c-diamide synthase, partial [Mangrovicoccus sp.]
MTTGPAPAPRPDWTGGRGLILAAPSSGSGKTTATLGLLRALHQDQIPVRGAKSGPDYIDPRFHEAACGQVCYNLDAWAMQPDRLRALIAGPGLALIEGAMGLFDGAPPTGKGATADLARLLKLPVVLVVDCSSMAQSIGALVAGFARHDPQVTIAGVILNRVGSDRHRAMLSAALDIPILGALPRTTSLATPSRHLGLVQAQEREDLESFLTQAAQLVRDNIDLPALQDLAQPLPQPAPAKSPAPPAQHIALAQDKAFAFAYPHLLADWRKAGAEILPFSPLADDPLPQSDLIYLPGGYPELYAAQLAASRNFLPGLRRAAEA